MSQTQASMQLTVVRNPGGKFDHWQGTANGQNCVPADCSITVQHGNNGLINIAMSDPHGPTSGPQQVTFSSNPISVPSSAQAEIHDITGAGTANLSFKDHNWKAATIKYTLNFKNAPSVDPIIQNDGGGPSLHSAYLPASTSAFAMDLAIAFLLGVIVALIVRRLASR